VTGVSLPSNQWTAFQDGDEYTRLQLSRMPALSISAAPSHMPPTRRCMSKPPLLPAGRTSNPPAWPHAAFSFSSLLISPHVHVHIHKGTTQANGARTARPGAGGMPALEKILPGRTAQGPQRVPYQVERACHKHPHPQRRCRTHRSAQRGEGAADGGCDCAACCILHRAACGSGVGVLRRQHGRCKAELRANA
jgi:hypothetical protein